MRSPDKLYHWLLNHHWFGKTIRNIREQHAIPLHTKILTISLLWKMLLYSAFAVVSNHWVRMLLAGTAVEVSIHILHFKTLREGVDQG